MNFCAPVQVAIAFSVAYLVLDIMNRNYEQITFHLAASIFIVIGLMAICNNAGEWVAWAILSIPFIVIFAGLIMIWVDSGKDEPAPSPSCSCPSMPLPCRYRGRCPCRCRRCLYGCAPPTGNPNAPLPPSVTEVPPASSENTLGCPSKKA